MKKCSLIILCLLVAALLCSCDMNIPFVNKEDSNTDDKKEWKSTLAKDEEFCKSLHVLRNPYTNGDAVVRGDGTIILNTMLPSNENLRILNDVKTGEQKYIAKTIHGKNLEMHIATYSDGEVQSYPEMSLETKFYDINGNDTGLSINSYSALYAIKNFIVYYENENDYDERELRIYNVLTKNSTVAPKSQVSYFGSHMIFSTDGYGYDNPNEYNKEILICDDDLNVVNKIEGYSFSNELKYKDLSVGLLMCDEIINKDKEYSELVYQEDYKRYYNYIDENFNLIFDEPVNNRINFEDSPIVTIHKGDIEFDFNFETMKKVSEDRPYSGFDNYNEKYQLERQKYAAENEKINKKNDKYDYVETKIYNDIVLFFAYYGGYYDENTEVYMLPCDIYSLDGELLLEANNLVTTYEESGYFLVDYQKLYNFNMEIVKEFPTKTYVNMIQLGDKIFFKDSSDENYNNKQIFNLYDEKMNIIYDNVNDVINYTYDDYLVVITNGVTKIIDKNLNVIKEFDKRLDIRGWYTDQDLDYRVFTNLDTKRMGIIDGQYNIIIDGLKSIQSLEEKCFGYANGFKYGLMDYENNVICDFSIFNTMMDDSVESDYNIRYIE